MRMKRSIDTSSVLVNIIIVLLMIDRLEGAPRNQIIKIICNNQTENNATQFSSNFIKTAEKIGNQIQSSPFATASTGTAPDANYGLAQCYGDLSTTDCILCYDSAHYATSRCFPYTGATVYQEGCFMRFQNYSFYEEYVRPNDTSICGNTTRKNSVFQDLARQAVSAAVRDALTNGDYFAREVMISGTGNDSAYVFLEDIDCKFFQRKIRGRMMAVITAVFSAIVILVVALLIASYLRSRRWIQKKRTGSYDTKKLAKILTDSSLNFKYSTIEKATSSWDDSNKLGEGGFGTVYKAWRHFQQGTVEEILDPNLMLHTYPKLKFKKEAIKVVHVGLLCTQEAPSLRPSISMAQKMLVKNDESLPPPSNPPFIGDGEINEIGAKIQRYHDHDDLVSVATVSHNQFSAR
ncbi:hypothetical protein L1987_79514 [Smallanthus sonchifolius]|uniref:Uncharacterized protein n=1 Tax=Smallanthus sonchifolius TaxID=185202 RepID=A0ACB8ZG75_9ASTR|nr:hypothetical protein L1987_79514 [Smallanthus sonchifolius]